MEEILGIFGEVDHSDLIHKAQRIKGNQAGTLHVWFPCFISVRGGGGGSYKIWPVTGLNVKEAVADGSDQMPQPQMQAAHFGR